MPVTFNGGIALTAGSFTLTDPPPFSVTSAQFDGVDDQLIRDGSITTAISNKTGLLSLWFKTDDFTAEDRMFSMSTDADNPLFTKININLAHTGGGNGLLQIGARPTGFETNTVVSIASVDKVLTAGNWYHGMASWDLNGTAVSHVYVDGVSDQQVLGLVNNGIIDYGNVDLTRVSGVPTGPDIQLYDGCLSELYFTNEYLDLSIQSNREKFILGGSPVDLTGEGAAGALPTGSAPLFYFKGNALGFATNAGVGGSFTTVGGGLTNCVDIPV